MKLIEYFLFGSLIVLCVTSMMAAGQTTEMAGEVVWFVGAALAVVKGMRAILTGKVEIIPGWTEFSWQPPETIDCQSSRYRFWMYVLLIFVLAGGLAAYGIYSL